MRRKGTGRSASGECWLLHRRGVGCCFLLAQDSPNEADREMLQ